MRASYVAEVLDGGEETAGRSWPLNQPQARPTSSASGPSDQATTWWFETLLGHPQIRPPHGRRKELHFFDHFCTRELRDSRRRRVPRAVPAQAGQIAGAWTPRYMHDFWTPRLLARAAPDAKLLIMFRDPIERFRSGVPHRLDQNWPAARMEAATADAIERCRYATQLRRLLACHDESRISILEHEKRVADRPASTAARSASWASTRSTGTRPSTGSGARRRRRARSPCGTT